MELGEKVLPSTGASGGQIEIYTMCHCTNFVAVLLLHVPKQALWMHAIRSRACYHGDVRDSHQLPLTARCPWCEISRQALNWSSAWVLWPAAFLCQIPLRRFLHHSCHPHQQHQQPLLLPSNAADPCVHSVRLFGDDDELSVIKF